MVLGCARLPAMAHWIPYSVSTFVNRGSISFVTNYRAARAYVRTLGSAQLMHYRASARISSME